jgi:hypothetical protein
MYFNHATAGAIAVKPIIDKYENVFTEKEKTVLWFVGITSAVLPDLDIAYSVVKKLEDHRSFVTHGFSLYLIVFFLIYLLSFLQKKEVFGKKFFKVLSLIFLVGITTHFVIDFVFGGVALLAPFSYKIYGFDMVLNGRYPDNRLLSYVFSKYMIIEIVIFGLFLYVFRSRKYQIAKFFSFFYFLISIISFVSVSLFFF